MFTKAVFTSLAIALTSVAAAPAFAASQTCKDVHITLENETGKQIKVIDMDFKMRGYRTKSEPIKNSEVPSGRVYTATRNLEKAAGRDTKIIVKYRVRNSHSGFDQWSKIKTASSSYGICERYAAYKATAR